MPEPLNLSTPLAYALAYARIGWHVFPVEANAKTPLGRLVPRGMLDATTDEATISKWWRQAPQAGVGVALHPSGLVALDIDPRNGGDATFEQLQSSHGSLRSDVMAMTGGGGEHHVFVIPPGVQVSLPGTLGPGVDVKANGYIVVEPSIHPSGRQYVWEASSNPLEGIVPSPLPDWLRGAFVRRQQPQEATRTAAGRVREGGRNNYLSRRAYGLKRAGLPHSLLYQALIGINDAECEPPLEAEEVRAIADGKRVIGAEEISANDEPSGAEWMDDIPLPDEFTNAEPAQPTEIPIKTLAQLREHAQSVSWVVKGLIQSETVGMIFGGGGTFKSFICLDMALHVAHGLNWCGRKTKKGPVVYIAAEGGAGLWRRIDAWHRMHGLVWDDIEFYVIPAALDLNADASAVKDAISALGCTPAVVVVDTMSQTYRGEENSANEVAAYFAEIGLMFRAVWQCAVVIVHHTGHSATERPRGSSAMTANLDFTFGCFRDADEMLATLCNQRQKDGETADDVVFSMTRLELGRDEDGDAITSLVAAMVRSTEEMLEIMQQQAAKGSRKGRNAALLDIAKDGMTEKDLRSAFYDASDIETSDGRRQAFHRAMEWARKNGILAVVNGQIRILRRI